MLKTARSRAWSSLRSGRPTEDAERFSLRDPTFADSLATERLKARAAQGRPAVAEGRAALEAFAPTMIERIEATFRRGAAADQGEGGIDAARFRATMAASALGEEISTRQANALVVLAGIDDDGLSELFAGLGRGSHRRPYRGGSGQERARPGTRGARR